MPGHNGRDGPKGDRGRVGALGKMVLGALRGPKVPREVRELREQRKPKVMGLQRPCRKKKTVHMETCLSRRLWKDQGNRKIETYSSY